MSALPRVVVATGNAGKLREIEAILGDTPVQLVSLASFDVSLPEEGDDYEGNAIGKARAAAAGTGLPAVGDDSGLEVEALGGRPGVRSARYGGPGLDDAGRVEKLLGELAGVAPADRGARFVCVAALAWPEGRVETALGVCPGEILSEARGDGGFGYDPVFRAEGTDRAMAEIDAATKDRISHRGRAFSALREHLATLSAPA